MRIILCVLGSEEKSQSFEQTPILSSSKHPREMSPITMTQVLADASEGLWYELPPRSFEQESLIIDSTIESTSSGNLLLLGL